PGAVLEPVRCEPLREQARGPDVRDLPHHELRGAGDGLLQELIGRPRRRVRFRMRCVPGSLRREMPARDRLHEHVRKALLSDGWTITHDPLRLRWRKKDVYADLGAERFVGAEKGSVRIAVEIKSFTGPSPIDALEKALGQFTLYHD